MKNKLTKTKYEITILRPGGNDTALVKGIVRKSFRKKINDEIMKKYSNVEQVGFYAFDKKRNLARLEMAGGEFCGNATRSLSYLLLDGKKGDLTLKVSGAKSPLKAGVDKNNSAYAQIPIFKTLNSVRKISKKLTLVKIRGIYHLIVNKPSKSSPKTLKKLGKELLRQQNLLLTQPAAGVMFVDKNSKGGIKIEPIVWVRDIQTLFYETACASGTAAIGLWAIEQSRRDEIKINVLQPSKQFIEVVVKRDRNKFISAKIEGPIKILKQEVIYG